MSYPIDNLMFWLNRHIVVTMLSQSVFCFRSPMTIDIRADKLNSSDPKAKLLENLNIIASLAGVLIAQNLTFVASSYLLLLLPQLTLLWVSLNKSGYIPAFLILNQVCALLFTFEVSRRALKQLGGSIAAKPKLIFLFLSVGLFQWLLYALPLRIVLPLFGLTNSTPALMLPLIVLLSMPLIFLSLRLFLFPIPTILSNDFSLAAFKKSIYLTLSLSKSNRSLPLKLLIAPVAISVFLSAIPLSIFPDGRQPGIYYLSAALENSLWIFASFLSVGAGLLYLNEKEWREAKLEPYREDRLKTLTLHSPKFLRTILSPSFGTKLLAISLLIWTANFLRLQSMVPAVQASLVSAEVSDRQLVLTLALSDRDYRFRGFIPAAFRVAGETGATISAIPEKATDQASSADIILGIPQSRDTVKVQLVFKTDREAKKLIQLQDLFLYYRAYKMLPLPLNEKNLKPAS